ncbi:MAG: RnfABCDGE type electron transport complex subunit D [Bacteroidales bacterium]|nr:RnfABCDGE type electron transport complex subunit D [Bacteroidales bacterium]MEE3412530.1 RnfABCDGE type electron transport complex subunit D [Bacteroidales bacterium]
MSVFNISGSPHVHSTMSTKKIMWGVVIAMLPALLVSIYFFGINALLLTLVSVASCLFFEWVIQKYLLKGDLSTVTDGSAVITGMLLAFNVPSSLPLWMIILGSLIAIGVGKMTFGGLGKNPFNPALVGRVFLFLSFPTDMAMSAWPKPSPLFCSQVADTVTGPTSLSMIKHGGENLPNVLDMLVGNVGGSLGEISAIAILIGGVYMLCRKIITWHIPVSFLGSAFVFALILHCVNPEAYVAPVYHLLAGGMMLGAVFMATDMVTSPITHKGQIIFGCGCGILTIVFRCFGPMPEGVSFAILIMNGVTPLINKFVKTDKFGYKK